MRDSIVPNLERFVDRSVSVSTRSPSLFPRDDVELLFFSGGRLPKSEGGAVQIH